MRFYESNGKGSITPDSQKSIASKPLFSYGMAFHARLLNAGGVLI